MRTLFLRHPGTNSREILNDLIDGFERAGLEPMIVELGPLWQAQERVSRSGGDASAVTADVTRMIAEIIRANGVGLTVGLWANGVTSLSSGEVSGRPVSVFDQLGVPHVMWWLDAPQWAHRGQLERLYRSAVWQGAMLHGLINDASTGREASEVLGMGRMHALPYGVNERVLCPANGAEVGGEGEFDVVFGVGPGDPRPTELMLRELESEDPDEGAIRRERAAAVLEELRGRVAMMPGGARDGLMAVVEGLIASQLEDPHRPMLERLEAMTEAALVSGRRALLGDARLYVHVASAVRRIEAWRRPFTVAWLARRFRTAVFGGGGLEGWPLPAVRLGELKYGEMSAAYGRGRMGLNVMRWQDDTGVNIKPLEISGSGRPCLMGRRVGIEGVLEPGREIAMFGTVREAGEWARRLVEDGSLRQSMAGAALERVRAEHTWRVRAGQIVERVLERGAQVSVPAGRARGLVAA